MNDQGAELHPFSSETGEHLFVVNGSQIYDLSPALIGRLESLTAEQLGLRSTPRIDDIPLVDPPIHAFSLAVAQKCNMGCTYCYASGGDFGERPQSMPLATAHAAIDRLLEETDPGESVMLAFMGGEPLVNRAVVRQATEYAAEQAAARGVRVRFRITTNATLLTAQDIDLFVDHAFAVTVSLDGVGEVHNKLRPLRGGRDSYDHILQRLAPLLAAEGRHEVSARVTVTPRNLRLVETLKTFVELGFHSVGFSPMLRSPSGLGRMQGADFDALLEQMLACGQHFQRETIAGRRVPFANLASALKELHRGTHRPYPCGAGAGYFGVSASGEVAACHRFINDEHGQMGTLDAGLDRPAQRRWLSERHVHTQEPCRSCWARYLCGGGCHHEVLGRGRPACSFIRDWLHYCLQTYVTLQVKAPWYFDAEPAQEPAHAP